MNRIGRVYECLRGGRLPEAELLLATMLRESPQDPEVHRARAVAAQMTGRMSLAVDAIVEASRLAPADANLQLEAGRLLASAQRSEEAAESFRRATGLQPERADAWFLLGMTLYGLRRDDDALPAFRRAHALAPGQPQIARALAETEYALERHAQALALYEGLAAPGQALDPGLFLRLSQCRRRTGAPAHALTTVEEGLRRYPDDALLWQELGWVQEDLGDAAQAQQAYARAHALRPGWGDPLAASIALLRAKAPEEMVSAAGALLANEAVPASERAYLHYVLGKRDDACGAYADAARHWSNANALRRRLDGGFDRDEFAAKIDAAIAAFSPQSMPALRHAALEDERPLFVLGMPRSGTTLVEQVLAAHPQAYGCGELTAIVAAANAAAAIPGLQWPRDADRVEAAWLRDRAQDYLAIAGRGASADAARLIDKQPYNFLHIGLIAMLFADARIVWCRRDPRDIALSIYSESFSPLSSYATDLDDIAFVIAQQERLMRHWQVASPLPILEVRYETMVTETESQIRRLIDFAGLPWDERCLEFHRSGRSVQTLSRWQVRQPVHTKSVGRWRNYPQWFADV